MLATFFGVTSKAATARKRASFTAPSMAPAFHSALLLPLLRTMHNQMHE
jgi:hypothetical protein